MQDLGCRMQVIVGAMAGLGVSDGGKLQARWLEADCVHRAPYTQTTKPHKLGLGV